MQSLHPGPLPQQVDEWIVLQQQNCDDLMASAERTFKQLCAELDATKLTILVKFESQKAFMRCTSSSLMHGAAGAVDAGLGSSQSTT